MVDGRTIFRQAAVLALTHVNISPICEFEVHNDARALTVWLRVGARSAKCCMIWLRRINRAPLVLNSDLIEFIETTPDTVISLTTGKKLVVVESADEVIQKVVEFRRSIAQRGDLVDPAGKPGSSKPEATGLKVIC